MIELRDYQRRAVDQLYAWFAGHDSGNPCLVLPTGAGKSHIVATICKEAVQQWPDTRILVLTHAKELIEQNSEKMRQHWPGAPMGVYSASVGRRQLGEPITFAGIQSVRTRAEQIGHVDLVLIDEAHTVSHREEGGYRSLVSRLAQANPAIRVVGLTATPYRLGHGLITDKPALFDALIEPVSIEELVHRGFLAPLRSKVTREKLDASGVKKRGGEYVESDLQRAMDTADNNARVVREVIELAGDRRSWLFFCAGVNHARHVSEELARCGISSACVTGETPKHERARILSEFKSGGIRALTNANVLTTGFDAPDTDLIAFLRPTMSPGLYVQMAGRGMRQKSHTDHCLALDFAGVVARHGPITAVQTPRVAGAGGEAPVKVCDECHELCHTSVSTCPSCGHEFPRKERVLELRADDIMGICGVEMRVTGWRWRKHISRASGKAMLAVTYYGALSDKPVTEYMPVLHAGYAGDRAVSQLAVIARRSGAEIERIDCDDDLDAAAVLLNSCRHPSVIEYKMDGKFYRVTNREFEHEHEAA